MTSLPTTNSKRLKNDLVLLLSLLLLGAIGLFFVSPKKLMGSEVKVTVDGKVTGVYELSLNQEIEIKSEDGINNLVIEDGNAYISFANCPDLYCKKHQKISRVGETIVCLPHKVVIEIVGEKKGSVDAVTQ